MPEKRCFVVMGFGIKTDLATGRKLNLDKSYLALIKPVVESKGITCLRADEIRHSGTIDVPMYQQLLTSDIVIADLSTANVNAFYELGIRHALRPRTTIIMSEEQLNYPFDVNHIMINRYTHLGESIDYFEVLRFQKLLGETIDNVLNNTQPDSPVYTFLDGLIPPALRDNAADVVQQVSDALSQAPQQAAPDNQTLSIIINQAEAALSQKQFALAKGLFNSALLIADSNADQHITTNNSYIIHRLAYTTYKAELPDYINASQEAMRLLGQLDLQHTNDSETVILAGRIEKKLYFFNQGEAHLGNAILYFERGCYLLNNRYNNINLAFLLNLRVDTSIYSAKLEKIADMILANRIRRQVLLLCERDLANLNVRKQKVSEQTITENTSLLAASQRAEDDEQLFWILVNKAEAHFGLGQMEDYENARFQAAAVPHEEWMMQVFDKQIKRLQAVLDKYSALLID
jgi:hypothetical protein